MKEIKLKNLTSEETATIIPPNTILLGYMGSISHGTYIPSKDPNSIDDKDMMGACIAPKSVYLGLNRDKFEQVDIQYKEYDSVVYELRKLIKLLLKGNPNVIGLLWLKPVNYIHISPAGQKLIDNRGLFTSKFTYHSFTGYAYSQLHKMTHMAFDGYMGEKRKKIVQKYGYDVKNASHLIRLLKMNIEFLTDGILHVFREDAQQLMEIKRGEWTLEQVKAESDRLFKLAQEAYVRSKLPPEADAVKAEGLLLEIMEEYICQ